MAQNSAFLALLDYVEPQYLSVSSNSRFISHISIEFLNSRLWSSICRRLLLSVSSPIANPRMKIPTSTDVKLNRTQPFDGVFHHLWTKCGRNPHLAGVIEISAPTERSDRQFHCYDLISHESKSGKWWGTNDQNRTHFVLIDFKDLRICPSAYSVKVHSASWTSQSFLRSWRFEGSNNGSNWSIIDSHTDSSDLRQNDKEMSFEFSSSSSFRFLRFLKVGVDWSSWYQLSLQGLEVFGRLIAKPQ
jgi:hypothetical protein